MPQYEAQVRIQSDGSVIFDADDQAHAEQIADDIKAGEVVIVDTTVEVMDVSPLVKES